MKSEEKDYEQDIKNNKVKQGFLVKRSRIIKQWKQRWMVLTKTHLYSFVQKQVYKKPTEKISLKQVSTIKSYYKNQYNRHQIVRVESEDADFYLSAKNHQQKWAWMTAIQKMTDLMVCPQEDNSSTTNLIRQSIRMSTAIRKTFVQNAQKKEASDLPKDFMKRMNITIAPTIVDVKIVPTIEEVNEEKEQLKRQSSQNNDLAAIQKQYQLKLQKVNKQLEIKQGLLNQALKNVQKSSKAASQKPQEKILEKQVEKIVEIQVEKIVQKEVEKIVYVPEIKEKIVHVTEVKQVIKYRDNPQGNKNGTTGSSGDSSQIVLNFFQEVMNSKCENPKPLIQFVVFLIFCDTQKYTDLILGFATSEKVQYSFSNAYLQVLNQCSFVFYVEIDQDKLNNYLKFISILYENNYEYFYSNDLKLLIDILLRQIQFNRSQFNQFLIINVFNSLSDKKWFQEVTHKREDLISIMTDIKSWTSDIQCKFAVEQLLDKL